MTQFQLTIELSAVDTEQINKDGFKVTLAKSSPQKQEPLFVWASFAPFERSTVRWQDVYGLYASPDPVKDYPAVNDIGDLSLQVPAEPAVVYPFENGVFGEPRGETPQGTYSAANDTSSTLTFGLTQAITANGIEQPAPPISGAEVLSHQQIQLTPRDPVFIFLLKEVQEGPVEAEELEGLLEVPFSPESTSLTVHWDGQAFVLGPLV